MIEDPDITARKTLLSWMASNVNADLSAAPTVLWHYTTAAGLMGIVETDRLWATDTRFLNDSQEISYGMQLARRTLAEFDVTGLQGATSRFVAGLADPQRRVLESFADRHLRVFVACFCGDGDLLSQWRGYAGRDSAGGYALGFTPPGPLPAWPQAAPGGHGLVLRRVIYDPVEQTARCKDLFAALIPILDADPTDLERQNAFGRHLVDGVVEFASFAKHPAFEEEHEWRIAYVTANDPSPLPVRHRPSGGHVVPFVELEIPAGVGVNHSSLPVSDVNCGPCLEPGLKRRGVESFLESALGEHGIRVNGSLTPLRL